MSQRTWVCVPCGKSYRRDQRVRSLNCSICHSPCEYVEWKIHIPSPKRRKAWDEFWKKYRAELKLVDAFNRGELRKSVSLELLNRTLYVGPMPGVGGSRPKSRTPRQD